MMSLRRLSSRTNSSSFAQRHPFAFQLLLATAKTCAADLLVQTVVEHKKPHEIDLRRNAIFLVFGFTYLGGFQYWLMVHKFGLWFPSRARFAQHSTLRARWADREGMKDTAKMVMFDLGIHLPFLYFPSYYACKESVISDSWNPLDWFSNGLRKYWDNHEEDWSAMIRLWGPVDCVQFSVMPVYYSMPFRHLVSFFWTAYVSFTRGAVDNDSQEKDEPNKKEKQHTGETA